MAIIVLFYVLAFFFKVFRCHPVQKVWKPKLPGYCFISEATVLFASCVASLVSGLLILFLPIPLVWQLQASWKRRVQIMLVFAGGIAYAPPPHTLLIPK